MPAQNALRLFLAFLTLAPAAVAGEATANPQPGVNRSSGTAAKPRLETHKDLIEKARNLTLQRDRLQASQVLVRGLRKENKGSPAYRELAKALEELSGLLYTEKGQMLHSLAESVVETKPREAIEHYQAALRAEEGNVSVLKALARAHLALGECDQAGAVAAQAEAFNPVSGEVRLLRLQAFDCAGLDEKVGALLASTDVDLAPVERFARGLQIRDFLRRGESKKARQTLGAWESAQPEYPDVHYWKWKLSFDSAQADRAAAGKYVRLCQNLTPRAKKSYSLDIDLCKHKGSVEEYLKSGAPKGAIPPGKSDE